MKIVHFAPFAPNRAGIYEAARDMVRADSLSGHTVSFVDTGPATKDGQAEPLIGAVDDRGGFKLQTQPWQVADDADVLVMHSGVLDAKVVRSQAPMIWIVHGRPLACFRPEQAGGYKSYSLYAEVAKWPRTKKMVHFWPLFSSYWRNVFPEGKELALDFPPIDGERFTPDGPADAIEPQHRGRYNGLICDSWREDIDCFEITNGAIAAAKRIPGLTWHFYGVETPLGPWEYLMAALRNLGALGQVSGRALNMERVYRSADFLLTPHRIITRTVGEAVCCGLPIIAAHGNVAARIVVDVEDPLRIALAVEQMVEFCETASKTCEFERAVAEQFSLPRFGRSMTAIYQDALES